MPTLRPFRDYSEHDVINLFRISGLTNSVNKGSFVQVASGWQNDDIASYESNPGTFSNTVNLRYGVRASVSVCGSGATNAIGMTLYDLREFDELGEALVYHPRKAAEMQAIISGQAMPIVTRGMFLYSGVNGTVTAGANLYPTTNGELTTQLTGAGSAQGRVGVALGPKDARGFVLIRINCI